MDRRAVCTVGGVREVRGVRGREGGAPAAAVDRSTTGRASRESKSGAATTQASSSTSWHACTSRGPGHTRTQDDSGVVETGRLGGKRRTVTGHIKNRLLSHSIHPPSHHHPTHICSNMHTRHWHMMTIALTHAHEPKPCVHSRERRCGQKPGSGATAGRCLWMSH